MPNPLQALRAPQGSLYANTWALRPGPGAWRRGLVRRIHRGHWPGLALIVTLLVLLGAGGCKPSSQTTSRPLSIAGSTSVQPFAEKLAEIYMHRHPRGPHRCAGVGPSAGIYAANQGAADLGASSRELLGEEKKLVEIAIAFDGIAVIVHPSNPLTTITLAEIRKIFSGAETNWSALGLPPTSSTSSPGKRVPVPGRPLNTWSWASRKSPPPPWSRTPTVRCGRLLPGTSTP